MDWRRPFGEALLAVSVPIWYWGLVVNAWDDAGTGGRQPLVLAALLVVAGIALLPVSFPQRGRHA